MIISDYLAAMVKNEASDLYFSPGAKVLIKIHGQTQEFKNSEALEAQTVKDFAYQLMSEKHIAQFEQYWEANLGVSISGLGRFRVNVLRQRGHIAMVIRSVKFNPPTLAELSLPSYLAELIMAKRGLILVSGATGSGKSSSLAAMLDHRNSAAHGHILTIEDPIEFLHSYKKCIVNQREVGTDTKSYAAALKNAMREAPDVILIGEIRDLDTMRSAIHYAETGHLCLATIHASNALETLDRVVNFYPQAEHKQLFVDLSHNLNAIICQRLLPAKTEHRVPALETLSNTPYTQELIAKGQLSELKDAFERSTEDNVYTFDQSIYQLFESGKIDKQTAIENADSVHNMTVKIRLHDSQQSTPGAQWQNIEIS